VSSPQEMKEIADLCIKHNLWVLSDEAYFHLVYGKEHGESIVALPGMYNRTVILLTCSKSWAMTGWRLGAAIGIPDIIKAMMKLATNDEAMVTQFVQWGSIVAFQGKCDSYIANMRNQLQERRDLLVQRLKEIPGFKCVAPKSTFYLLVNVTQVMETLGITSIEKFRKIVLNNTGVSCCSRVHFGAALPTETQYYIRFAYSGITLGQIDEACTILKKFIEEITSKMKSSL